MIRHKWYIIRPLMVRPYKEHCLRNISNLHYTKENNVEILSKLVPPLKDLPYKEFAEVRKVEFEVKIKWVASLLLFYG